MQGTLIATIIDTNRLNSTIRYSTGLKLKISSQCIDLVSLENMFKYCQLYEHQMLQTGFFYLA